MYCSATQASFAKLKSITGLRTHEGGILLLRSFKDLKGFFLQVKRFPRKLWSLLESFIVISSDGFQPNSDGLHLVASVVTRKL